MGSSERGSIYITVMVGAMIAALAAGALLWSLRQNLIAVRADRLSMQADLLADSAIEEGIAYLHDNTDPTQMGPPPISPPTTEWLISTTGNWLTLADFQVTTADTIYYRQVNSSYLDADEAYLGMIMRDDGTDARYSIYGFGVVRGGGQISLMQKMKYIGKSNNNGVINFFVLYSESLSFLRVKR